MNKYFDSSLNRFIVTIYPGEFYVSKGPEFVSTILGSCVAVVLYDSENMIGGINHFMLARQTNKENPGEFDLVKGRFGEFAIEMLLNEMIKKGADVRNLEAKVFGGGNIFNITDGARTQVGEENIKYARKELIMRGIPVIAEDLGGFDSRKIILDPMTFRVFLKRLKSTHEEKRIVRRSYFS